MRCDRCGEQTIIKKGQTYQYKESGLDNVCLMNIETRICKSCGYICPRIPNINGLHDTIARAIVLQPFPLLGKDIRFLRQHMGLKAKHLASLIRTNVETLSRWETEKQNIGPQSDSLMRFLFIRIMEERMGSLFPEKATEKIASVKDKRPRKAGLSFDMNKPSIYSYECQ